MKKVLKTVSLAIILFATIGLIYYEESITAFAKNYDFLNIREGQIIENGDILEWEGTLKEHMIDKNMSSENSGTITSVELYYNGQAKYVPLGENDHSLTISYGDVKAWRIDSISTSCSNIMTISLSEVNYQKPSFSLECNPETIEKDEVSECTLSTKYYNKFNKISFKINHDDYELTEINAGESFERVELNEDTYTATAKDDMEENEEGLDAVVAKFKIKAIKNDKNENTDNIQINNLTYENEFEDVEYEVLADTVNKPETKEVVEPEENPYTGSSMYLFISLIIIAVAISAYYVKKKNNNIG